MDSSLPRSISHSRPPLEHQVAEWLARRERGLTPDEEKEMKAWLAAEPERARLFREMDSMWDLFDRVQELPEAQGIPDPQALGPRSSTSHFRLIRLALPLAAAAALALGYFSWWRPAHYSSTTETAIGDFRQQVLPDGSVVDVNTDTRLAIAFFPEKRVLRLDRGEAHFTVTKDPARPFIVEAPGVSIRAVGTAFVVRVDPASVEILVSEGKVEVTSSVAVNTIPASGAPGVLAAAGEKVTVPTVAPHNSPGRPPTPHVCSLPVEEIHRRLAWQEHWLQFEDTPLSSVVKEFNRYNRHRIVVSDDDLASKKFGGIFRPDDPESFIRMLKANFGIAVVVQEDATYLRRAP